MLRRTYLSAIAFLATPLHNSINAKYIERVYLSIEQQSSLTYHTNVDTKVMQWVNNDAVVFVKLEELHIVTARKPLIHQNQLVAKYLHRIQPCML